MTEPGDCRRCKDYRECTALRKDDEGNYTIKGRGKDWYHYGEIRWCPYQVIWILQHGEIFRAGQWVTKYEESAESKQLTAEAYFVKAGIAISEVDERLLETSNNGELLWTQIEDERTFNTLSDGAREVLMYVKGFNRKKIGFKRWLRIVYYAPKTVKKEQSAGIT